MHVIKRPYFHVWKLNRKKSILILKMPKRTITLVSFKIISFKKNNFLIIFLQTTVIGLQFAMLGGEVIVRITDQLEKLDAAMTNRQEFEEQNDLTLTL